MYVRKMCEKKYVCCVCSDNNFLFDTKRFLFFFSLVYYTYFLYFFFLYFFFCIFFFVIFFCIYLFTFFTLLVLCIYAIKRCLDFMSFVIVVFLILVGLDVAHNGFVNFLFSLFFFFVVVGF